MSTIGHLIKQSLQLQEEYSQALILLGDFNHPDICWKNNIDRHRKSRRFLRYTEDIFLMLVKELMMEAVLLALVLTNKKND